MWFLDLVMDPAHFRLSLPYMLAAPVQHYVLRFRYTLSNVAMYAMYAMYAMGGGRLGSWVDAKAENKG